MKKINLLVLSLTALALVSCGGTNNPTNSNSVNVTSSSNTDTVSLWDAELSTMMKNLLGEDIPYIQFNNKYTFSLENDSDGDYIYISSDNEVDRGEDYASILVAANYTFLESGIDEDLEYPYYFYQKETANGTIIIQYDAFPGYQTYAPCFEIYAWVEGGSSSGSDTPTGDFITDWSTEDKAIFNQYLGEVIPVAPLYEGYSCEYNEDEEMIYIIDTAASSSSAIDYCTTLENAGYVTEDYYNYTKDSTIEGYYVNLCIFDGCDYGMGFWIMASLMKSPVVVEAWPAEELNAFCSTNKLTSSVPAFEGSSSYAYTEASDSFTIKFNATEDEQDAYLDKYGDLSYIFTQDGYGSLCAISWIEDFYIEFYFDTDYMSITVVPYQADYTGIGTEYPTEFINNFVTSTTTTIPTFTSTDYKYYDYSDDYGVIDIIAVDHGKPGTDAIEDSFKAALEDASWTIDDTDYESAGYYATSPSQDVKLTFYSYYGTFFLEIENVAPAMEAASTVTISATSTGMPSSYSDSGASCTIEGYSFIFTNAGHIGGTSYFQIKKNVGVIECTSEIENLAYVQINYASSNTKYCTVEGKTSDGTWEAITGNDYYQYDLTGYVSFKIIAGAGASYFDSIVIGLNA